jgi:hypothetical protein
MIQRWDLRLILLAMSQFHDYNFNLSTICPRLESFVFTILSPHIHPSYLLPSLSSLNRSKFKYRQIPQYRFGPSKKGGSRSKTDACDSHCPKDIEIRRILKVNRRDSYNNPCSNHGYVSAVYWDSSRMIIREKLEDKRMTGREPFID